MHVKQEFLFVKLLAGQPPALSDRFQRLSGHARQLKTIRLQQTAAHCYCIAVHPHTAQRRIHEGVKKARKIFTVI